MSSGVTLAGFAHPLLRVLCRGAPLHVACRTPSGVPRRMWISCVVYMLWLQTSLTTVCCGFCTIIVGLALSPKISPLQPCNPWMRQPVVSCSNPGYSCIGATSYLISCLALPGPPEACQTPCPLSVVLKYASSLNTLLPGKYMGIAASAPGSTHTSSFAYATSGMIGVSSDD